ncbi:matrix-remodeling-associated protein 7 [Brachypodium distachyon]|uniref:Uncharacterized protein n=1 Tax=Brachypodium distachyon TaxID=15368 RepID=A0A0Q3GLH5_BRADI|nr:matrix-remodeling-associated protein 7 [Brachypodium distachyon]KQK11301.1 hypothetical protein BRADI_2g59335v3 [Brachypodium distachyon]|eukprot:XP_010233588.2 matrix-remodeling-associated protein 7 [Brachypodium distachyon]
MRESRAAARARATAQPPRRDTILSKGAAQGSIPPCSSSPRPSPARPSPAMGCAASTERAERRRRDLSLGLHSEASTAGQPNGPQDPAAAAADGRGRGFNKVAPEPREAEEPALALPGSPSFRIYCQKEAAVDALVDAADPDGGDSEGFARVTETPQATKKNDPAHGSSELSSKSKETSVWLKFRGQAILDAVYNLFTCNCRTASAPPLAAAAAAKSHHTCAASPPAAASVATSYP